MLRPLTSLRCLALLAAVSATGAAQEAWSYTLKMAGGPTFGGLSGVLGKAGDRGGYQFGADFEVGHRLDARSRAIVGIGYRAFPGDFKTLSYIPFTYSATGVNPTVYETRIQKPEAQGFLLSAAYQRDLAGWEGLYWQVGLRLASNKMTETDTGTTLVTDGRASTVTGNVTAVKAIAEIRERSLVTGGPLAGLGYEFREFTVEANLWMTTLSSPSNGHKSGLVSELAFGFRF